jgi:hypothetical protein
MRSFVVCVPVALPLVLALPARAQETKPADKRVVKDKYAPRPCDGNMGTDAAFSFGRRHRGAGEEVLRLP